MAFSLFKATWGVLKQTNKHNWLSHWQLLQLPMGCSFNCRSSPWVISFSEALTNWPFLFILCLLAQVALYLAGELELGPFSVAPLQLPLHAIMASSERGDRQPSAAFRQLLAHSRPAQTGAQTESATFLSCFCMLLQQVLYALVPVHVVPLPTEFLLLFSQPIPQEFLIVSK